MALTANAQSYKEEYVDWGSFAKEFGQTLQSWQPGEEVTADDNFFISRVKPKARFRNEATQVRTDINEKNDKKILFWVPIDDANENAMPNGVYDSEVFNMWQYITIYGNWTAPQGRIPGNFADVAHKNGVSVSSVAGIPFGGLYGSGWQEAMEDVVNAGAEKTAQFLHYYGVDGLGYNSEFSGGASIMSKLIPFHKELKEKSLALNPLFCNAWYDGTNESGSISFDNGFGTHNDDIADGAVLFFNYNWNSSNLLSRSVDHAAKRGIDPLDLYAGMNMQGAEPKYGERWPLLAQYPISIGLWGAHSQNMFWESRGEKGGTPDARQRTYQLRTERWFTGGTRNPANCPTVTSSMKYNADNYTFHGMSSFMTAKSTLSWDLAEEPFITYFNLGNGKFFNWNGERQHNGEWYNIGVQDYLPTWRWWFTKNLLGRTAEDVVANGLDAEFSWDDAWVGGSTVRIYGSTAEEYLHLFKTKFEVKDGDVITFRYKLAAGSAEMNLVLTATGAESTPLANLNVCAADQLPDEDEWLVKTFVVGQDIAASEVALVALQFKNAQNANIFLGEFSIVRGEFETPERPEIESASVLSYGSHGVDGKIIFDMDNDKAAGEPCYNIDVNTSLFKLYAQQANEEPVLMGITTSWAGLIYNVPFNIEGAERIRFGVSAMSLDMKSESDIKWSSYSSTGEYTYNDDIQIDKTTIKPNEDFNISFVDPKHEEGTWTIVDSEGNEVKKAEGMGISVPEGLANVGNYNLVVKSYVWNHDGTARIEEERTFSNYIQITSESVGALPKIYTLTANGKDADITVAPNDEISLAYTGRKADGSASQGVNLKEMRFGVKCADIGVVGQKSFSVAFWLKINKLSEGETQLLAVANKVDQWPKTDWGWVWTNMNQDGSMSSYTFRGTDASNNNELRYKYDNSRVPIGSWVHLAFVFEYSGSGFHQDYYINGVKQEVTRWNRQADGDAYKNGDPGYQTNVYSITNGQVLSVGGSAHGRNGIDGVVDNFQVWDKVMTAEDVLTSMGDLNPENLPADIAAYWDFEQAANADFTFKSVGKLANVSAGIHDYVAEGSEGQGKFGWEEPQFTSGCPFVSGSAFPVTTVPSWKTKKGLIENVIGNDEAGSATVKYPYDGDYAVTLTLENSLGRDQRTFQVITVGDPSGINNVENGELNAYAIDGVAVVEFAKEGNYNVSLYNVAGQKIASKNADVAANGKVYIAIENKGTYVLVVEQDGKPVRNVKLFNK